MPSVNRNEVRIILVRRVFPPGKSKIPLFSTTRVGLILTGLAQLMLPIDELYGETLECKLPEPNALINPKP